MAGDLTASVREDGRSFRTITLTLRHNDMAEVTRSVSREKAADLADDRLSLAPRSAQEGLGERMSKRSTRLRPTKTQEKNDDAREAGKTLIKKARETGKRPSIIFANNRLEGNVPLTIETCARKLAVTVRR